MKRIKGFVKGNIKLFIGIIVGGIIFGGGVYAATVAANTVSYSNASSGITATNVQGAIDALYNQTSSLKISSEEIGRLLSGVAWCNYSQADNDSKKSCAGTVFMTGSGNACGGTYYTSAMSSCGSVTCKGSSDMNSCVAKCACESSGYIACMNGVTTNCKSYCKNNSSCEKACINSQKNSNCS